MSADIRWKQRLANYQKALLQLEDAVELRQNRGLSSLEQQGVWFTSQGQLPTGFGY